MNAENLSSQTQLVTLSPTTTAKQLLESWRDPEYRAQFVRERVQSSVALQLRALREQRQGLSQTELSKRIGKAQPWISKVENPNYGKWTVSTLLDFAAAFDTDLEIKFRPFSRSLYELSHQSEDYFKVPSFDEEISALEDELEAELAVENIVMMTTGADKVAYEDAIVEALSNTGSAQVYSPDVFTQTQRKLGMFSALMPEGNKNETRIGNAGQSDRIYRNSRFEPAGARLSPSPSPAAS